MDRRRDRDYQAGFMYACQPRFSTDLWVASQCTFVVFTLHFSLSCGHGQRQQHFDIVFGCSFPDDANNPLTLLPPRRRSTCTRRQRTSYSDEEYMSDFSLDPDLAVVRGGMMSRISHSRAQAMAKQAQRTEDELFHL